LAIAFALAAGCAPALADPPSLAGSTSIGGARTGYAEVVVPRDLRPLNEDQPSVALEGGGGFLGVVLRKLASGPYDYPPTFYALRVATSNDGGALLSVENGAGSDNATLPAGTYRLYLVADQPGQVTLTFPTLPPGSVVLSPDVATPFQSGVLQSRRNGGGVFSFGQTGTVFSQGLSFVRATVDAPPPGTTLELCQYFGDQEQQAGSSAYDPGCPGGTSEYKTAVSSSGDGAYTLAFEPEAVRLGLGGSVSTVLGPPPQTHTFGMWMSYDQAPAPSEQPGQGGSSPNLETAPPPETAPPADPPTRILSSSVARGSESTTATLASHRLLVRGRRVALPLVCSRRRPCRGVARLSGARPVQFRLAAGTRRVIFARLGAPLARRLVHQTTVKATLTIISELQAAKLATRNSVVLVASRR
jgi:hypothetical protein